MKFDIFELGIFIFNSYVYYLTRGSIASTRAFDLLTCAFNLPTRSFSVPTSAFNLATRAFSLLTSGFELIPRGFELVTHKFELVARGFELVTLALLSHLIIFTVFVITYRQITNTKFCKSHSNNVISLNSTVLTRRNINTHLWT